MPSATCPTSRNVTTSSPAPAGGAIHSTVSDMARWLLLNLSGGEAKRRQLIHPQTLAEIRLPVIAARTDPSAPTPCSTYAMGWFVDTYNNRPRVAHGGYIHDVNSEVMFFPDDGIGIVTFTNFGFPMLARLLAEHTFDLIMDLKPVMTVEEKLAQYEAKIDATRARIGRCAASRIPWRPMLWLIMREPTSIRDTVRSGLSRRGRTWFSGAIS